MGRMMGFALAAVCGAAACGAVSMLMMSRRKQAKRLMKQTSKTMHDVGDSIKRMSKQIM